MNPNNYCVIMAGGVGSRFWPMSRQEKPKQFIDILGTGETLLQSTFRRIKSFCLPENIIVVSNVRYKDLIAEQLPEIPLNNILSEPARRDTARSEERRVGKECRYRRWVEQQKKKNKKT